MGLDAGDEDGKAVVGKEEGGLEGELEGLSVIGHGVGLVDGDDVGFRSSHLPVVANSRGNLS